MQTSRLNVAMIGHGFIGRVHSNAFHQAAHFFQIPYELNLKVVCVRNRAMLEAMASQWNWEEVATDWTQVVTRPDIQVVDIAVRKRDRASSAICCRTLSIWLPI